MTSSRKAHPSARHLAAMHYRHPGLKRGVGGGLPGDSVNPDVGGLPQGPFAAGAPVAQAEAADAAPDSDSDADVA